MRYSMLLLATLCLGWMACNNDSNNKNAPTAEPDVTVGQQQPVIERPNADAPQSPAVTQFTDGDNYAALLVGTWRSTDDPKSQVEFTKTERIDLYEGTDGTSVSPYEMGYGCEADAPPSADGKAPAYIRTTEGTDDDQCWYITSITADRLELSYVGRGNTLTYERVAE